MLRKAIIQDVKSIHAILTNYADQDLLLPRSLSELYDHLRDFYVIENSEIKGSLLGVCTISISWEDLGEIRSLAVVEEDQKRGLGSKLVEACLSEAVEIGLTKVFVLTLIKGFFARFGFKEIEKSSLPHKIWADCLKCPKFPDCDEIAMILKL
ncbi:MAG: N-acetyltransferase [Desulfobacteraceae bacterium]|nr:MAG: N-acetyltransferase [Desulfobacteraceae bacterium]